MSVYPSQLLTVFHNLDWSILNLVWVYEDHEAIKLTSFYIKPKWPITG